ncbi:tripartite tricarboxylate transporter substrate binding protein [Pigmentiphaga soli]|uniref:Tripartite tricarboxylate transporter substrate binding protein n=1 Tax=Pigmentiphaga soli TaxID=1007095 RepID=A0ABP8GMG1_9BURK
MLGHGLLTRAWTGARIAAALAAALLPHAGAGAAQPAAAGYPERPIRVIVPFAAGSSTDITARRLTARMAATLGQSLVVENRPGAVGQIGAAMTAQAAPDGYTVMLTAVSSQSLAAALKPKSLPYDPIKDFTPIGRIFTTTNFVVVNPKVPANSLRELMAYSKTVPGGLSFGSGGQGSSNHLAGEALKLAGANVVHVPYNNVTQAITDLLAGQIPMMIYTAALVPYIKDGRIKALAVTSPKRHPLAPEVPTVVEQGVPSAVVQGWSGLLGPAGLPAAIRDRLFGALREAMADPGIVKSYTADGQENGLMDPAEFQAFLQRDLKMWKDIVARSDIPTD